MAASLTDSELLTYGGNGLLIPLEDYINEETMPNLMKIVEKRPEMLATCTMPYGHIYGLREFPKWALNIRTAILIISVRSPSLPPSTQTGWKQ